MGGEACGRAGDSVCVSEDTAEQPCQTSQRTGSAECPEWGNAPGRTGVIAAEGSPVRGTASGEDQGLPRG